MSPFSASVSPYIKYIAAHLEMQKGIFTLPTYITSLYSSKRQLSAKLTEGEIQSANGTKQLYKKGGLVTALSGNPCNWVPYT